MALGLTLLCACTGGGGSGDDEAVPVASPEQFDYFGMFVNLADEVIVPNYRQLATNTAALADPTGPLGDYCAAIDTEEEAAALDTARLAWRDAMGLLQESEVHQLGPVADENTGLHDRLIKPADTNFSACGVDQSVVLGREPDFDLSTRLVNQKGMGALEYLLFNESLAHNCPAQIPETRDWNERSEAQRKRWRCDHALRIAADVAEAADAVLQAWLPEGGNYRAEFAHPDQHEAVIGLLSDGLFYIESDVKDRKLGSVLGLHNTCSQVACPDRVESLWSALSLDNIQRNLISYRRILTGDEGLSFDDMIASLGLPGIAERMVAQVDDALALLDTIDTPLKIQAQELLESGQADGCVNSAANPDTTQTVSACALHGYLKHITDTLRTDFVTAVDVDLPDRVQSDND